MGMRTTKTQASLRRQKVDGEVMLSGKYEFRSIQYIQLYPSIN